jgi:hypothetical protein
MFGYIAGINDIFPGIEENREESENLDVFVSYRRSNGSQLARYYFIKTLQYNKPYLTNFWSDGKVYLKYIYNCEDSLYSLTSRDWKPESLTTIC